MPENDDSYLIPSRVDERTKFLMLDLKGWIVFTPFAIIAFTLIYNLPGKAKLIGLILGGLAFIFISQDFYGRPGYAYFFHLFLNSREQKIFRMGVTQDEIVTKFTLVEYSNEPEEKA